MKKVLKTVFLPVAIIALSIGIGFLYDHIWQRIDLKTYPKDFAEYVEAYSKEYGIPEYVVYSTIKVESNFQTAALSKKGAVGLMQITPDTFEWLQLLKGEKLEDGMLYDPNTNIKYGAYLLSYLFNEFGDWETAHAAYNAGLSRVRGWLADERYGGEDGKLKEIPFEETREYVKKISDAESAYKKLYY